MKEKIIAITKNNSAIHNEGTFQNEPVITVYSSGDRIKIDDDEVTIKNIDEYVIIDSV
ncbi:hypothetical protein ACWO41_001832 [Clostridium sporogenes]